jgi:hypothetical protein
MTGTSLRLPKNGGVEYPLDDRQAWRFGRFGLLKTPFPSSLKSLRLGILLHARSV